ncbi:hypothetical protein GCM10012279_27400 [Micromonospora yangpuensis]|nr:hypothetical protein GCM10012279_27400 [Micromonospora yangpuensis]
MVAARRRSDGHDWGDLLPPDGLAAGMGAIHARDLPAGKARLALMVALGGGGVEAVRQWFSQL